MPFVIERVGVSNYRKFDNLEFTPRPPENERFSQWIVLTGDSGTGKTTVLQALACALNRTAPLWLANDPRLIRRPQFPASFRAIVNGVSYGTHVTKIGREVDIRLDSDKLPLALGYGCQRFMAGSMCEAALAPAGEVNSLFEQYALVAGRSWLVNQKLKHYDKSSLFYDALINTLKLLLPGVEQIDVTGDGVFFSGPRVGPRVPMEHLSDAYRSMLCWVIDLIARWAQRYPDQAFGGFADRMEGVVLIDRVDLHVSWEPDLIPTIRQVFPRLSFVVTCGQLCARGARQSSSRIGWRRYCRRMRSA
jgi:energy-coupling factor transporter ATP-binding protein EcfA2